MHQHDSMARLAQSAERKALNLVVVGSSPTVGAFCASLCFSLAHRSANSVRVLGNGSLIAPFLNGRIQGRCNAEPGHEAKQTHAQCTQGRQSPHTHIRRHGQVVCLERGVIILENIKHVTWVHKRHAFRRGFTAPMAFSSAL